MELLHRHIQWLSRLTLLGLMLQGSTVAMAQTAPADTEVLPATDPPVTVIRQTESLQFEIFNRASYGYFGKNTQIQGTTNQLTVGEIDPLIDPLGQVLGCGGQPLLSYDGFSVALYNPAPNDPTGTELGTLVSLTPTELPDLQDNGTPAGLEPNETNVNPFALSVAEEGRYSFLLDRSRGQLDIGSTYILVVNVPPESEFTQRRIRIEITNITPLGTTGREQVSYQATSLDGFPVGVQGETQMDQSVVLIEDAEQIGLQLLALQFANSMCNTNQVQISKSGDRANATPGDTVLYRLAIRNVTDIALDNVTVTDQLPVGFKFLNNTVLGAIADQPVELTVNRNGTTITFSTPAVLPEGETLTLVYAAQLTPDAIRGDGRNTATTAAQRVDNDLDVQDGPVSHRVRINPGLLSDCGTLLGRVFVDKNFDGKQQPGEPGIPNAVVWMDDGNRITTDEDGLFHVKCVLPGYRTGALDISTLPGYTLAPNLRFIERNSPSRLVHLAPGGLVQMNFGVTPAFQEESE